MDYWARFQTFVAAHSEIPDAQVFLTNQSLVTFKTLSNLASQLTPPKDVNELAFDEIATFMKNQFDPARYVCSNMIISACAVLHFMHI